MIDPATVLGWFAVVMELGYAGSNLWSLGQQIKQGQVVSMDQINAARDADIAAHDRLVSAGQFDRPDEEK
ncbi:MAG: hypothetical protein PHU85_03075 [Phycisphaerae bacterium]|nr:hypothetical protein [Phycisphaerae bacterium]